MGLPLLVAATFFMEFLDSSALTPALPEIAAAMGVRALDLNPAVSAYALTLAVFILPSGWIAEKFSARKTFAAAIALFTLASALCAFAATPQHLIAARALQGVGGAMMTPVGRFVVLRITPKAQLMRAMAFLIWPALTAPLLGPSLGGYLTAFWSWRAIFLVNLPLGALAFVLALIMVPKLEQGAPKPFDLPGFLFAGGFLTALLIALDDFSATLALDEIRAPLAATLIFGALAAWRLRAAANPLLDFRPLAHKSFSHMIFGGTLARVMINAMPFLLPLMFQLCLGYDPLRAGLALTPLFLGNIAIKPLTAPILNRFGFRDVLIVNGVIQAATMAGYAALTLFPSLWLMAPLLVLSGASRSLHYTALTTLTFADVPPPEMSAANLIQSTTHQASFAFGVGLGAALARLGQSLWPQNPSADFQFAFVALGLAMLAVALRHGVLPQGAGAALLKPKT